MLVMSYDQWIAANPDEKEYDCLACNGRGYEMCDCLGLGCTNCGGDGEVYCQYCGGFKHNGPYAYFYLVRKETALYNQWQGVKTNE